MKRFAFAAVAASLVAGTQLDAQAAQGGQKQDTTKKTKSTVTTSVKPAGAPAAVKAQTPADTTKPKKKRSTAHSQDSRPGDDDEGGGCRGDDVQASWLPRRTRPPRSRRISLVGGFRSACSIALRVRDDRCATRGAPPVA